MKKSIKILIISFVIAIIMGIFAIIKLNNTNYSDNYTPIDLYNAISDSFYTEGGVNILDDDIILEFVDEKPSYLIDHLVIKAKIAKNINEIGIFRVEKGSTNEMKDLVERYVSILQESYRAMDYFPEEIEKINNARVKVLGSYVIYSFLNERDTESFYNAIENEIRK